MARPPKSRKLNIENVPSEVTGWLTPLVWVISTFFSDTRSALDNNLTFEDNFLSSKRVLSNISNSKIKNGVLINTGINKPTQIFVDVIKSDGTKLANVPAKWIDLGNGQIRIVELTALRQTGTIEVQTNSSQAIELNSAHRNSIGNNPHKLTPASIGIDGYVEGWTQDGSVTTFRDNSGNTVGLTAGGEQNVQADWDVTNTLDDAYIRNKPLTTIADNKTRSEANEIAIALRKATDASVDGNTLTINKTDGDITFTPSGEENVQSDWNVTDMASDAYIDNKPTTITPAETTLLNRFPTSVPPNGNVLIGDGSGSLIYRNLDAATIPIQSFHYVDYDHTTGMAIERYAEDTETVQIDPLIEYQPGFIQNEFELNNEGILSYIG